MENPRVELVKMINLFVSGKDRTQALVQRMEGLLIDYFSHTELYEELGPYLAMYSPTAGEKHLYNEEELARELSYVVQHYLADEDTDR